MKGIFLVVGLAGCGAEQKTKAQQTLIQTPTSLENKACTISRSGVNVPTCSSNCQRRTARTCWAASAKSAAGNPQCLQNSLRYWAADDEARR